MRRTGSLALAALAVLASGFALAPRAAAEGPIAPEIPPPIYSRQRVFSIPFKVEQPAPGSTQPRKVQLHASEDQGATWRVISEVEPSGDRFSFRADRDGDFWFFVRTLDEQGKLQPAAPPRPELRVVVDTLAPRLNLKQQRGNGGELTATWQVLDSHLKPETFKLEFQSIGAEKWETVNTPRDPKAGPKIFEGEVTFWPGAATGKIRVRASISDQAGNPAVSQVDVDLDQGKAEGVAAVPIPVPGGTDRLTSNRSPGTPAESASPSAGPRSRWNPDYSAREPFRGEGWEPNVTDMVERKPPADATASAEEIPPPLASETVPPGNVANAPRRRDRPVSTGGANDEYAPRDASDDGVGPWPPAEELPVGSPESRRGNDPEHEIDRDDRGDMELTGPATISGRDPSATGGGPTPKYVNSLRFELEYDVESVGPAGIGRVELWGTSDGGRTWTTYGIDPDNRSPFVITVDEEGLYGFQIVVESGTGLGGLPPKSGDAAEVSVGVDLTKPEVELLGIEQGAEERAGELLIRWEATDALLGPRPVSLAFRDARGGDWSTFASNLRNSGKHLWQIDRRVPEEIYLRVEVRDAAGNVTVADSVDPISLDRIRPQGRIRNVRPARETTQGAQQEQTIWR